MKLIYTKDGFTKNEKEEWRVIIFNNILDGLRMIVDAMEEFHIDFEYENSSVSGPLKFQSRRITNLIISRLTFLLLWKRKTFDHSSPYQPNTCEHSRTYGRIPGFRELSHVEMNLLSMITWASMCEMYGVHVQHANVS